MRGSFPPSTPHFLHWFSWSACIWVWMTAWKKAPHCHPMYQCLRRLADSLARTNLGMEKGQCLPRDRKNKMGRVEKNSFTIHLEKFHFVLLCPKVEQEKIYITGKKCGLCSKLCNIWKNAQLIVDMGKALALRIQRVLNFIWIKSNNVLVFHKCIRSKLRLNVKDFKCAPT